MSDHAAIAASAAAIRRSILTQSRRANRGHIGSALSVADLVAGIVHTLDVAGDRGKQRDCFVLSKGHAALAWYAGLHEVGLLEHAVLDDFCADGSRLAVHPDHRVHGVRFSTGSLGQGVSYAVGSALAGRLRGSERRTVVLASDAELNCGITWEALMFAGHHRLGRLQVIVDLNGSQGFGMTHDVLDPEPLASRLSSFGFDVHEIDGHDPRHVSDALVPPRESLARPRATIARTQLGHGVSFMEGRLEWHYLPMTNEQYERAMMEVAACAAHSSRR